MLLFSRSGLLAIAAACLLSVVHVHAQRTGTQTLLWRISGKGLTKPSYLFGTMHLSDKRLFRFDDSVYHAIEQSAGLAIELNPDEMVAYYINKTFDQLNDKARRLEDILDAKDYKKYSGPLSRKLQKPADEITEKDILKEKNRWVSDYLEKGEMPTFVDAYLYNIARRQGKWLGGIEDLADQTGLINDVIDKSDIQLMTANEGGNGNFSIEHMIQLYTAQDIAGIGGMINNDTGMDKSGMLYRRNVKMARRMDSLSQQRTMFFAVGAAHLPGDSGVISWLRRRGFTVSPVFSQKKIEADKYVFKEVPLPWYDVTDVQGFYTVKMPGNPASVKLYGLVDTKFLYDIFNMSGYCTMAMFGTSAGITPDSAYNVMTANMFHSKRKIPFREIRQGGISGREYLQPSNGMYLRLRLFMHQRVVYIAMGYAFKAESLKSPDADRFFESFTINQSRPATPAARLSRFADSSMAISMETGAALTPAPTNADSRNAGTWDIRTLAGTDAASEVYVMLNQQAVRPGYHIKNDSSALEDKYQGLRAAYAATREPYTVDGRRGMLLKGRKAGTAIKALIFARGNRSYTILVLGDSAATEKPQLARMFASVRLLPYKRPVITAQQDSAGTFSTMSPATIMSGESRFVAFDTGSNTSYTISTDTLGPYTWRATDSAFWAERLKAYAAAGRDQVIESHTLKPGADKGKEWIIRKEHSDTYVRVLLLLHGNVLYQLHAAGERDIISGDMSNSFFKQFRLRYPAGKFDLLASKAGKLLKDIGSEDSLLRSKAVSALNTAVFTKRDLPRLHEALLRTYRSPYSNDTSVIVNTILASTIAELADTGTIAFIRKKYPTLNGPDSVKRGVAAVLLSRIKTAESYSLLATLLGNYSIGDDPGYQLGYQMRDSLPLLRTIYPKLLPLAADKYLGLLTASLMLCLYDSGLISINDLRKSEPDFIALSAGKVAKLRADTNAWYSLDDLIRLLGAYNSSSSVASLQEYGALRQNNYLREAAMMELLRHNHSADTAVIRSIAADSSVQLRLYRDLKAAGKESLFPKRYLTQRYFARSLVYETADDDDDNPSAIEYLGERRIQWRGSPHRFYLYQVRYGDESDDRRYLAVAGGFSTDDKSVLPAHDDDISSVYWKQAYEQDNEELLFQAYLAQYAKDRGEEDDD